MDRVRTGIPHFDALLHGGPTRGGVMLVKGGPGSGKTVLGVQWVCQGAAEFGEPGAIIVLEESPQQFYRRAHAFGWDLRKLEEQNKVRVIFTSAEALSRDILTGSLLVSMLAEIDARRVAIDPISHYRLIYRDAKQLRQQIYGTVNALKRLGQTSLLLAEVDVAGWTKPAPEEYLSDIVISLGEGPVHGGSFRCLEVLKADTYDYGPCSALYRIAPGGIQVVGSFPPSDAGKWRPLAAGVATDEDELGFPAVPGGFRVIQLETDVRRVLFDLALVALGGPAIEAVVYLANSGVNPGELWEIAVSTGLGPLLVGETAERQLYLLEPFGRRQPALLRSAQLRSLRGYDAKRIISILDSSEGEDGSALALPRETLIVCDISDMFYHLGQTQFRNLVPRLVDAAKHQQASLVGIVNPRLMTTESLAWIQGMADSVERLWEAGGCRFVQRLKGINPAWSEPRLLFETPDPPFFVVVD